MQLPSCPRFYLEARERLNLIFLALNCWGRCPLFFSKSDIHGLGEGGGGGMWKDAYGVPKQMQGLCHCKELEMTAVFWEQSGQEAEASCFHLRGATVSSSYFTLCQLEPEFSETLSTGCQLLFCNAKRT